MAYSRQNAIFSLLLLGILLFFYGLVGDSPSFVKAMPLVKQTLAEIIHSQKVLLQRVDFLESNILDLIAIIKTHSHSNFLLSSRLGDFHLMPHGLSVVTTSIIEAGSNELLLLQKATSLQDYTVELLAHVKSNTSLYAPVNSYLNDLGLLYGHNLELYRLPSDDPVILGDKHRLPQNEEWSQFIDQLYIKFNQ